MSSQGSILLVDDEETFRESTCRLLERHGYECVCASDGDSGLAALRQRPFNLLITDIRMPGNWDLRLVREARELDRQMPVVLVTGYPSMDTAVRGIGLSVAAYLTKPVDFDELLRHVRAAVEHDRRRQSLGSIRQRLQACLDDLAAAESLPAARASRDEEWIPLATIRTLAACLSEALTLSAASGVPWSSNLCELLDCPQQPIHRRAILETIDVLKQTKDAFKSKLLADLRVKLEDLVGPREGFSCRGES